jgi:hypothetical protein
MKPAKVSVAALVCIIGMQVAHAGLVYDLADDFSATNNPNGRWQYGWEATLGSTFHQYEYHLAHFPDYPFTPIDIWAASSYRLPSLFRNPSVNPASVYDFTLQPYQAAFHPGYGQNDQYSIYRWIAPSAGAFSIDADWVGLGTYSITDVHVLLNGASVFAGAVNGRGDTDSFSTTQMLAAGAILDFAVGRGTDNDYSGDTTGIDVTIRNVPEPSSITLALLTLAGLTAIRRRPMCRAAL